RDAAGQGPQLRRLTAARERPPPRPLSLPFPEHIMKRLAVGLAMIIAMSLAAAGLARAESLTGNAENGHKVYDSRCGACHSLDASRVGPMHRGVYGRKAGAVKDFNYSPAVKRSGIVWSADTLDRWLTNPQALIPG